MGNGWAAKLAITTMDCRRLGAMAVLLLECVSAWSLLAPSNASRHEASNRNSSPTTAQPAADANFVFQPVASEQAHRIYYPYSVIPGGAKNSAELRNAVAHDAVVAKHYSDFDLEKARITRLSQARAVFVSYRVGDRIFWTKSRLILPAGEAILTDGAHMARTRCGNRLSEVPGEPVLKADPSPEAMEAPAGAGPLAALGGPPETPLVPPPTTGIVVPETPPGSIFIPPIPPIFPLGGSPFPPGVPSTPTPPGGSPPPVVPPPPPPPPPVAAPEPSSLLLLAASFACIWLRRNKSRA
jgi:hypothetical protein